MKVSKAQAAENRQGILDAASRLYRERGLTGVGVAAAAGGVSACARMTAKPPVATSAVMTRARAVRVCGMDMAASLLEGWME